MGPGPSFRQMLRPEENLWERHPDIIQQLCMKALPKPESHESLLWPQHSFMGPCGDERGLLNILWAFYRRYEIRCMVRVVGPDWEGHRVPYGSYIAVH